MAIAIVLGICFRIMNLDQEPYWHDKTYTSLRVQPSRIWQSIAVILMTMSIITSAVSSQAIIWWG